MKIIAISGSPRRNGNGTLGIKIGWGEVKDYPELKEKAYKLGSKVAIDIKNSSKYPFKVCFHVCLGSCF